ncbi:hypothetical protein [Endozoicomonas arenosclerae]|uniref:hypothetical protein n=1 Tax=Endozoicomonas arenosclerae TaxID=1633495 RepID=UPI0007854DAC|nr:hypothetical protein [Endozoicomonas arenosclerae]
MEGRGKYGDVRPKAWDILSKEYPVRKSSSTSEESGASFKGLMVRKKSSSPEMKLVPYSEGPRRSLRQSVIEKTAQIPTASTVPSLGSQAGSYVPAAFDPVFRQSWDDCTFRYKLPEVPQPDPSRATYDGDELSQSDSDNLTELQEACKGGVDALKEVISGESHLYEWLIFKARSIEKMFTAGKNVKKAEKWASTLDEACQGSPFNWRQLPLAVNYAYSIESKCKNIFPGDALEKKRLRREPVIMFFPPWVEKSFRDMPLSTIYSRYWSIRNSLGHKDEAFHFTGPDFVKSYPNMHSWLVAFLNASPQELEKQGLSELEAEAFKYLLDQTDAGVNVVKGKPQWHWQDAVLAEGGEQHQVSGDITAFIQSQDHLADLDKPAPSRPAEPLSECDSDVSPKKAKRTKPKKISVDPLSADLGEHVHVGLPETRKRRFVEREGVMDWDAVTKSMITSDDSGPMKKCKLSVKSSEPVDVEVDLKAEGIPLMVFLDLPEEMLAKIPPGKGLDTDDEMEVQPSETETLVEVPAKPVATQPLLTPTGGGWLPFVGEQDEGWSVDSDDEDTLQGDKGSESGFQADDEAGSVSTKPETVVAAEPEKKGLSPKLSVEVESETEDMEVQNERESVLEPLLERLLASSKSSDDFEVGQLTDGLPVMPDIILDEHFLKITRSYKGLEDFCTYFSMDEIILRTPLKSFKNWVRGLLGEFLSGLKTESNARREWKKAKPSVKSRLQGEYGTIVFKNDKLLDDHADGLRAISSSFRERLGDLESHVASKVSGYLDSDNVSVKMVEKFTELVDDINSAYEVISDFEEILQIMQDSEDDKERRAACQALKKIDFSVLDGLI